MHFITTLGMLGTGFLSVLAAPTPASSPASAPSSSANGSVAPMFQLSTDSEFAFDLQVALSMSNGGGANTGEILRTASQIIPGDFESYSSAFNFQANQLQKTAADIDADKFPVSVREAMFHAATYFRHADFFLHGNWSDPRIESFWNSQTAAFNKAISLLPVPGVRHTLQGDGFDIPVIFYKASNTNESLPTILVGSGYDAAQEDSYHAFCTQILARGWNCATYEGPGQPTVRRNQNLGFIAEWWKVVTPVVDYFETRPDVDMSRLALMGISFGGTLAPRASAYEHRFAATLAIDGIYDLAASLEKTLPQAAISLFKAGNKTAFDAYMTALRQSPHAQTRFRWFMDQSLWAFNTHSAFDWFTRLHEISMVGLADKITNPVFVGSGQDDTLAPGQPEVLAAALGSRAYYHLFDTNVGAGEHCQIGAESQLAQVAMDWLAGVFEKNGTTTGA